MKRAGLLGETRSCFKVEFSVKHSAHLYVQAGRLARRKSCLAKRDENFPCKTLLQVSFAGYTPIFGYCRRIERLNRRLVALLISLLVQFRDYLNCCQISGSRVCLALFFKKSLLRIFALNWLEFHGDFFPTLFVLSGACLHVNATNKHIFSFCLHFVWIITHIHVCRCLLFFNLLNNFPCEFFYVSYLN